MTPTQTIQQALEPSLTPRLARAPSWPREKAGAPPAPIPGVTVRAGSPGLSSRSALAAAPAAPADASQGTDERPEAGERREGLSQEAEKVVLKVSSGVGEKVGTELTMIFFFTSPDGLQRTLCFYFCSFEWL